jgi:hypothetical protein
MDCKTAEEYINLYIDKMLGENEAKELFSHAASCRKCERELENALKLKDAMADMGELEPPAGLAAGAIKKAKKRRYPAFIYVSSGIAAAVALVLIFSSGLFNNAGTQKSLDTDMERNVAAAPAPVAAASAAEEMAPQLAYSAAGAEDAAASAAPESGNEMLMTKEAADSIIFTYNVPAKISERFKPLLLDFISKNNIQQDDMASARINSEDNEIISFNISAENLNGLIKLVNDAGIEHEGDPQPGSHVEFTFLK